MEKTLRELKTTLTGTLDKTAQAAEQDLSKAAPEFKKAVEGEAAEMLTKKAVSFVEGKASAMTNAFNQELDKAFRVSGDKSAVDGLLKKTAQAGIKLPSRRVAKTRAQALSDATLIPIKDAAKLVDDKKYISSLEPEVKKAFQEELKGQSRTVRKMISEQYSKKLVEPVIDDFAGELGQYNGKSRVVNAMSKSVGRKLKYSELEKVVESGGVAELVNGASPKDVMKFMRELHKDVVANRALLTKNAG